MTAAWRTSLSGSVRASAISFFAALSASQALQFRHRSRPHGWHVVLQGTLHAREARLLHPAERLDRRAADVGRRMSQGRRRCRRYGGPATAASAAIAARAVAGSAVSAMSACVAPAVPRPVARCRARQRAIAAVTTSGASSAAATHCRIGDRVGSAARRQRRHRRQPAPAPRAHGAAVENRFRACVARRGPRRANGGSGDVGVGRCGQRARGSSTASAGSGVRARRWPPAGRGRRDRASSRRRTAGSAAGASEAADRPQREVTHPGVAVAQRAQQRGERASASRRARARPPPRRAPTACRPRGPCISAGSARGIVEERQLLHGGAADASDGRRTARSTRSRHSR